MKKKLFYSALALFLSTSTLFTTEALGEKYDNVTSSPKNGGVEIGKPYDEVNLKGSWKYAKETKVFTLELTWNKVSYAKAYKVYRKTKDGPYKLLTTIDGNKNTHYSDKSIILGTDYSYKVHYIHGNREVEMSNTFEVDYTLDSDGDGIYDLIEISKGLDPNSIDTDKDGLSDIYEAVATQTDSLLSDTDGDGVKDGEEDSDEDGLTNLKELEWKTNPQNKDTDRDHLNDGEEVKSGTSPVKKDSDDDFLDDDSESKFGTNPMKPDTDGNGVLDGNEKRRQEVKSSELTASISFQATGDAKKTTSLEQDHFAYNLMGSDGMVGVPIDLTTTSSFDSAELTFSYTPETLGDVNEKDLGVFYFNPDTWKLELVEHQVLDKENNKISATLSHFSTYLVADKTQWESTFIKEPVVVPDTCSNPNENKEKPLDLVFVIDSSGSMAFNDPDNYRISGAKEIIDSLKVSDQVAVVGDQGAVVDFDSSATLLQGLTDDKKKLKAAVDKIDANGGTDIGSGVVVALNELKNKGRTNSNQVIILLTDGDGSYNQSYTTTANQLGIKIFTVGLGNSLNESLLKGIAQGTGGDYYHTIAAEKLPELFEKARDVSGNIDSDGDCILDWIEKFSVREGGYVVEGTLGNDYLKTKYSSDYTKEHTDSDGLSDLEELAPSSNPTVMLALSNLVTNATKTSVHLKKWPRSNPNQTDTDEDRDNDAIDDFPSIAYTEPVILIHGIRDNTAELWGGESYLDNGQPYLNNYIPNQDEGEFTENILTEETFSKRKSFEKNGNWYAYESDAHFGNDHISYGHPDAQYVREVLEGDDENPNLLPYLLDKGYKVNKNIFVFNWENMDHVLYAAEFLQNYLNELEETYLRNISSNPYRDDLRGVDVTKGVRQEISFSLVGHSAGGLVSRTYIESLQTGDDPKISKLITVDTPHWGSNDLHNPGVCGSVLHDLDRDDSDIFYSNPSNLCPDYGAERLDFNNKNGTDYYFIGGLVGIEEDDNIWSADDYYYPEEAEPILVKLSGSNKSTTDTALFNEIKGILKQKLNVDLPYPNNSLTSENYFGDEIVTLGSQLGIPSDNQRKNDDNINSISRYDAFVYIGRKEDAEHSHITHQKVIHKLINGLLKDQNIDNLLD